jgi:hypothetical protein
MTLALFGVKLPPEKWLPTFIIVLYIGSAVGYGLVQNWRRCAYFIAAAVLNIAVTF